MNMKNIPEKLTNLGGNFLLVSNCKIFSWYSISLLKLLVQMSMTVPILQKIPTVDLSNFRANNYLNPVLLGW